MPTTATFLTCLLATAGGVPERGYTAALDGGDESVLVRPGNLLPAAERASSSVVAVSDQVVKAAKRGDEAEVLAWLDSGGRVDAMYERDGVSGFTLLMDAAYYGHERVVELLLQRGAEVNQQNSMGASALMGAADNGHEKVVELLIRHGAEIDLLTSNGSTALMYAAQEGHERVVDLLLQRGAEINKQDSDGATALMFAAQAGHARVVELLLQRGAKINMQDRHGVTALKIAADNGHEQVVKLLLRRWGLPMAFYWTHDTILKFYWTSVLTTGPTLAYLALTALLFYAFSFLWRLFAEQGRRGRPHRLRRTARERAMALLFSDMTALSSWFFRAQLLFASIPFVVWGWANTLLWTFVGVVRPLDARAAEPARGERGRPRRRGGGAEADAEAEAARECARLEARQEQREARRAEAEAAKAAKDARRREAERRAAAAKAAAAEANRPRRATRRRTLLRRWSWAPKRCVS